MLQHRFALALVHAAEKPGDGNFAVLQGGNDLASIVGTARKERGFFGFAAARNETRVRGFLRPPLKMAQCSILSL